MEKISAIETVIDIFDGNQWELLAYKLLHLKVGSNQVQKVPSTHGGDWGIEFYSFEGHAYQCYAPEKRYSTKDLYEHQRSKMTTDLNKFEKNILELNKLIEPTLFSRWIFLTTAHDSKDLNDHAAKKTRELRSKGLPLDADFRILIHVGDDFFHTEVQKYVTAGLEKLKLQIPQVSESDIANHIKNSTHFVTVSKKLTAANIDQTKITRLVTSYIKEYLIYQQLMYNVKSTSKELYEITEGNISSTEIDIEKKYQISQNLTSDELNKDLEKLKENLNKATSSKLEQYVVDHIARGVISDWLIRCPIEF